MMSSYFYPDGKPFGIQNSLKIFNASGYPVRIGRPHNFLVVSHNGTIVQALNATTEPLPLSVSNTSSIATNTSVVSSIMQLVANTTIAAGNAVNATNPTNSFSTLHRRALPKDPYHGFNDILNHKFELDINKFKAHQPFFITELHAIYNFARFISITASISYIYLWYGKDIGGWISNAINGRSTDNGSTDVHNRLMKAYTEVPEKVWAVWLLVFSAVTIIVCTVTPFYLPIWASLLAICVGIVGTFLNGFLKAISGARISNALVAEILIGYIYPGNIIVCAAFQSLTRNIEIQAVELLGDLKLGHYLHIPPVAMVTCQIMGVCIGAVVNTVTAFYVMDVMKEPKIFSDPAWLGVVYERFVNTAGIWGAIGPQRFFGPQTPYSTLYYGFALGIVVPFIPYIFNKMFPHHWWHLINPALLFSSMQVGHLQAGALYHLIIGFIFQFYIFRFKKEWFDKYMYIFAAALSFGAGICLFASIVLLAFRPDLKPAASFLNPGNVDWYCFDGSPKSSSKGGINH
jgi:OPT family oligopeptide transporter